jgi:flagellar P-ring protein precursor FlgI
MAFTLFFRITVCLVLGLLFGEAMPLPAKVRVKDIATVQGLQDVQVIGYGLVVGLDKTGDGRGSVFTVQSMANMLARMGIIVPAEAIRPKNVAAVMVTADIGPFARRGNRVDVLVSSLGDATSLEGGTLLMTPLSGKDGQVYAYAQGPVSTGGFNIETAGSSRTRKNYTLVGRVPDGAILEVSLGAAMIEENQLGLTLHQPDFTSAVRLAEAVNRTFGDSTATVGDAATVLVFLPEPYRSGGSPAPFIAQLETLDIAPDQVARVVVNERTGTIIVGENVRIATVAVAHGNLTIEINTTPVISQPNAFSKGETVVAPLTETTVSQETPTVTVMQQTASVQEVATALNALGVSARDIIAIFQALKRAGALQAELVIM